MLIAIDPGTEKCGLAVLNAGGKALAQTILSPEDLIIQLPTYLKNYQAKTLVIGQGAFGKELEKKILGLELKVSLVFVSEKFSTLEARKRYWEENKPQGFWRLIPTSLRTPPVPIDDYAAVILGERYLKG